MSNYFIFKRKIEDTYVPYAAIYIPDVQSVSYINDERSLFIKLKGHGDLTISAGLSTNAADFFAALHKYI